MKALYCGRCSSLHSGPVDGQWQLCDCGHAAVRWTDPRSGRLEVWAKDLDKIRVIGLHNGMLAAAFTGVRGISPDDDAVWRTMHEAVCREATGYLFHTDRRDCWAAIVARNETGDVVWLTERPDDLPAPKE